MGNHIGLNLGMSFLALMASACGESSVDLFQERATEIQGIYTVTRDHENTLNCAEMGQSILDDGTGFAFIKLANDGLSPALFYLRCGDLDACQTQVEEFEVLEAVNAGATVFSWVDVLGNFRGDRVTTGFWQDDGTCRDAEKDRAFLSVDADGRLEFVVERYLVGETPQATDGDCTTEGTNAAMHDAVCRSSQSTEGYLLEAR